LKMKPTRSSIVEGERGFCLAEKRGENVASQGLGLMSADYLHILGGEKGAL